MAERRDSLHRRRRLVIAMQRAHRQGDGRLHVPRQVQDAQAIDLLPREQVDRKRRLSELMKEQK